MKFIFSYKLFCFLLLNYEDFTALLLITAALRSILRPSGFADTLLAALPCQKAEGDRFPQSLNTCVFLPSVRMPGLIPQLWLVTVPTSPAQLWDLFVCLQQQLQQEVGAGSITELM